MINTTMAESSEKKETSFDFYFTLRPVSILKNAFQALADPKFNPFQEAVIQVGQAGCEITVWKFDDQTSNESFGYLRLKAGGLEEFRCRNPLRKLFKWTGIPNLFKASEIFEANSVTLFVVEGSDKLSFQWGSTANDFGLGLPVSIDLEDVFSPFESFPNVSYGFEAVLPSEVLRTMFVKLQNQPMPCSTTVLVSLQPATIEVSMGSVSSGSLDDLEQEEEHRLSMQWRHWKALENATQTANKCSVYLVTVPDTRIMLRFRLQQLGDMVFLNQAEFEDDPDGFPILGHFGRLN